ncbi:calcium/sodium antiporter [Peloplasma aerotolerans]|uniref:Calcium/sodium antiporter n=1 Tax=Peloplasma aerotolerans TaxID=3044389 RepID=A0AAW6U7G2_9MOLU|nr:calcium/sodium antiporter [Mariniplasma sp. M4Ah]MDI6452021.1 calcium/sodium antiporter [Mariniplasma sp. M4Ah]
MDIFIHILFLLVGFAFLIKGADFFIVSSVSIAKKLNVSPLIIGLTLVAFGTSLPELAVSFAASISARAAGTTADIAMGNVIGSNVANLTLILGFSAIMMPIAVRKSMHKQEFPFLVIITILISVLAFFFQSDAQIVWWESLILLLFFAFYMYLMFRTKRTPSEVDEIHVVDTKKAIVLLLIGLGGVSLGGYLVTTGAEFIAIELLVSAFSMNISRATTLVGLSIVALGTSLPELVTSIMAAKKGEGEIALGNVIGSNVFNTLLIVGLAGLVTPLGLNNDVLIDTVLLIGITAITIFFCITGSKISKLEGYILLGIYFSYILYIILRALSILPF